MEEWRDIKGYEDLYQISNKGRIKSLKRKVKNKHGFRQVESKILNPCLDAYGYYHTNLSVESKIKTYKIHQLVAIAFLGHTPNGYKGLIVDHIDNNPLNNDVDNLQLITPRENVSKDRKNKSSKYTGVCWYKSGNKWQSTIRVGKKLKHIGYYNCEIEAHLAYQKELNKIKQR